MHGTGPGLPGACVGFRLPHINLQRHIAGVSLDTWISTASMQLPRHVGHNPLALSILGRSCGMLAIGLKILRHWQISLIGLQSAICTIQGLALTYQQGPLHLRNSLRSTVSLMLPVHALWAKASAVAGQGRHGGTQGVWCQRRGPRPFIWACSRPHAWGHL